MRQEARPVQIKDVLKEAISDIAKKAKEGFCKEKVLRVWQIAVGKEASKHSFPAGLKKGVLLVNVDSPIWIYQLNIKKGRIEKKLGELLKQEAPLPIRLRAGEK